MGYFLSRLFFKKGLGDKVLWNYFDLVSIELFY